MAKLSGFMRSRLALRQQPLDEHPEAELLSAFAEKALSVPTRATVLAHLERCAECREVLLLSLPEGGSTPAPFEQRRPAARYFWRWPAAAALAGLMAAIVFTPRWANPPTPSTAMPPPLPPVVEQATAPAAPPKTVARAKATTMARRPTRVEPPILEAPPVGLPRLRVQQLGIQGLGFQSLDTSSLGAGISQTAVKRFVDTAVPTPRQNSVWRIEESGAISKSQDGKAWVPVHINPHVDQQTRLYALSVDGAEVWTGGTGGNLFHSTDNGAHWQQVEVQDHSGARLANSITKINFTPRQPLKVTTNTGAVWISFDGRLWHQQ